MHNVRKVTRDMFWVGGSMSQLARRSYRLLTVFRARSVPGNSASQMPAVPFLLVCRSRGCRYSSSYRQGLYPRLFPLVE